VDSALICVKCGYQIAAESDRIEVSGAHAHTRLNPAGVLFHFGCFAEARGCVVDGAPTLAHTWFTGCAWQYAHCGNCRAHLGWFFSGEQSFFGLIAERLA